jgi:dolichyl-phosphate beta-glucosyltransferase
VPASLHLVVPCYNEAARLNADAFLRQLHVRSDLDLVFVDDGSTDATLARLRELSERGRGRVEVVALKQNSGKAAAVRTGMLAAFDRGSSFAGYWDADLATPLDAITEFMTVFSARPDVEIVIGSRVKLLGREIRRSPARHYSGRVFATAASVALGLSVYDTQCGAKIFRSTERAKRIFGTPFRSNWIFDVEILSRYVAEVGAQHAEDGIYELPLAQWTDVAGSKLKPWHAVRAIWDLAAIARR